jgi:NAD(P)-dependent dehydrogenase (short-subunit alcohol dehydrogenase family)
LYTTGKGGVLVHGLEDKVVIVTGAASGIGLATARRLLADGATVVGADLMEAPVDLGDRWTFVSTDVTDEGAVVALVAAAVGAGGRLDGVVNAAGVAGGGLAHQVDADEWHRVIAVNLTGTFFVAKHVITQLLAQERVDGERGSIVTLASIEGLEGTAGGSAYNASKGGVVLLTKNLAIDYGPSGIRANAICPGFIETEMSGGKGAAERFPALVKGSALRRGGQPEEVAELASFLASDRATYLTGAVIPIDGGSTCSLPS